MVKVLKYIIGIILTVVPCVVCDYLIQYPLYKFDARETPVYKALLLLALCGVAAVLVYGGVVLLNKFFEWFSGKDMALMLSISSLILFWIMLFVFARIPIPYSWIPSNNEMAFGFGQFLIQLFTMVPSLIIVIICVIYLKISKAKRIKGRK